MSKKAFICHASEDKERFVDSFARKLMDNGIDTWYDRWEIKAGDSLVEKIFQDGLDNTDCIIIVLSQFSLEKPWAKKELNISVIKQIEGKSKLIPVVIDDVQVPLALRELRYIKINALNDYQASLEEIVISINGGTNKPDIGKSPPYVTLSVAPFPGLNEIDTEIFNRSCELALEHDQFIVSDGMLLEKIQDLNLSPRVVDESIDILDSEFYVRASKSIGGPLFNSHFSITPYGFEKYAEVNVTDYPAIKRRLYVALAAQDPYAGFSGNQYATDNAVPLLIIEHILTELEQQGLLTISQGYRWIHVYGISPKIKRMVNASV